MKPAALTIHFRNKVPYQRYCFARLLVVRYVSDVVNDNGSAVGQYSAQGFTAVRRNDLIIFPNNLEHRELKALQFLPQG
jgi:hypothetical protein